MSVYRLSSPYEHPPLRRRLSGLALAIAVNVLLLLVLLTVGKFAPEARRVGHALVVDLLPESHSKQAPATSRNSTTVEQKRSKSIVKPPPIKLPSKTTALPILAMSAADMAAGDIRNLPKAGSGDDGDSDVVGRGPHGEVLYAAEWARRPTDAELGGYLPHNAEDGFGLIACKTIPGDRVEDCVELDQTPGSHFASAARQAAWQFRVRPPRKNGVPLIGSWVSIRIDYTVTHIDG